MTPPQYPCTCPAETPSPSCWPGTALLGLGIPPAPIAGTSPAAVSGSSHHGGRHTPPSAAVLSCHRRASGVQAVGPRRLWVAQETPRLGVQVRPDGDTAALCPCSQPPCGRGTQLWVQPGRACSRRLQSRWPWTVLQSRRLLMQGTRAQRGPPAGRGRHHVLLGGGGGCHRVAWKGQFQPICPPAQSHPHGGAAQERRHCDC